MTAFALILLFIFFIGGCSQKVGGAGSPPVSVTKYIININRCGDVSVAKGCNIDSRMTTSAELEIDADIEEKIRDAIKNDTKFDLKVTP